MRTITISPYRRCRCLPDCISERLLQIEQSPRKGSRNDRRELRSPQRLRVLLSRLSGEHVLAATNASTENVGRPIGRTIARQTKLPPSSRERKFRGERTACWRPKRPLLAGSSRGHFGRRFFHHCSKSSRNFVIVARSPALFESSVANSHIGTGSLDQASRFGAEIHHRPPIYSLMMMFFSLQLKNSPLR